jgi:hypothetical protein
MATPLRKLTKTEWDDVRGLATTVTGYEPSTSTIKGQTTVQVLNDIKQHIMSGDYGVAEGLCNMLIKREAFNAFVGIEGKKRRRN